MTLHRGSHHCGAVVVEVEAPESITREDRNCSICCDSGYLRLIVPVSRVRPVRGEGMLTAYSFNARAARPVLRIDAAP